MNTKNSNSNHELDLELLDGKFLNNSEDDLSQKDFLTDEKVKMGSEIASALLPDWEKGFTAKK